MGRTKQLLEILNYDYLSEAHFLDAERPFLTQFNDKVVLDTIKENKPLKND